MSLELAAINGHHVAGTAYEWFHEWKPRHIAVALVHGKVKPGTVKSSDLRKVPTSALGDALDQSAAKGRLDAFDKLAAESDRRDNAKAAQRDARAAKAQTAEEAKAGHYARLLDEGHDDESAVEKAYGVPVAKQRAQAALANLRAGGHKGAGLREAARSGYKGEVTARYHAAEDATNGHMLSPAGKAAGVNPASLFDGQAAAVTKYASPELKEWFDQHGRPSFNEYLADVQGHTQAALKIRSSRGDFHAATPDEMAEVIELAADSMAKASTHEKVGPGPLWKTPGLQLPAYIQHVANELIKQGKSESEAIRMAVGIIKNWASGTPSGGEKGLQATTIAAARKALAEWEAAKAKAHATSIPDGAAMEFTSNLEYIDRTVREMAFTESMHPRVPSGAGGGEFTAGGGAQSGAAANGAGTGAAGAKNTGADAEAKALLAKMQGMTPAERQAFMRTLTGAQLQALAGNLARDPKADAVVKAELGPVLASKNLNADGTANPNKKPVTTDHTPVKAKPKHPAKHHKAKTAHHSSTHKGKAKSMSYIDEAALEMAFPAAFQKGGGKTNPPAQTAGDGPGGIPNVGQLRRAIMDFNKCPGPQRAAQAARIKAAASKLGASELPWVKTFTAKNQSATTNGK